MEIQGKEYIRFLIEMLILIDFFFPKLLCLLKDVMRLTLGK